MTEWYQTSASSTSVNELTLSVMKEVITLNHTAKPVQSCVQEAQLQKSQALNSYMDLERSEHLTTKLKNQLKHCRKFRCVKETGYQRNKLKQTAFR